MSTRTKTATASSDTTTTRIRSTTKLDAEKAVALKKLSGESTNLPRFLSDTIDAVTGPILKAAGVQPSTALRKAKVTK